MSKISGTTFDVIVWTKLVLHSHFAANRSDEDNGGVSATNTLMLKSVTILSKRGGKVLAMNNCLYLKWRADPLFIGAFRGPRYSGDPVGLVP